MTAAKTKTCRGCGKDFAPTSANNLRCPPCAHARRLAVKDDWRRRAHGRFKHDARRRLHGDRPAIMEPHWPRVLAEARAELADYDTRRAPHERFVTGREAI